MILYVSYIYVIQPVVDVINISIVVINPSKNTEAKDNVCWTNYISQCDNINNDKRLIR